MCINCMLHRKVKKMLIFYSSASGAKNIDVSVAFAP
jgi:hypothetical protein